MKDNAPHLQGLPVRERIIKTETRAWERLRRVSERDRASGRVKPASANFGALVRSMGQAAVLATKGMSAALKVEVAMAKFRAECAALGQDEDRAVEEAKRLTQHTALDALQAFDEVLQRIRKLGPF